MIFKLLIVDDEATMRKGIANFMDWASIGCEVAGTASDGLEAIRFLQHNHTDIVITDIKMPEADGLAVAKYVFENMMEMDTAWAVSSPGILSSASMPPQEMGF